MAVNTDTRHALAHGLDAPEHVQRNLTPPALYEWAIQRGEGQIANDGPFCANTTPHTGRSPNDKFVVKEPSCEAEVWWGKVNQPMSTEHWAALYAHVVEYLGSLDTLFVQDLFAGADPKVRVPVRFVTPNAWHANFVRNMFIRPSAEDLTDFDPGFTVLHAPELQADPEKHGTNSSTFIVVNFAERTVLIGGTR